MQSWGRRQGTCRLWEGGVGRGFSRGGYQRQVWGGKSQRQKNWLGGGGGFEKNGLGGECPTIRLACTGGPRNEKLHQNRSCFLTVLTGGKGRRERDPKALREKLQSGTYPSLGRGDPQNKRQICNNRGREFDKKLTWGNLDGVKPDTETGGRGIANG